MSIGCMRHSANFKSANFCRTSKDASNISFSATPEELQLLWFLVTNTNIQAPLLVCSTAPECCPWGSPVVTPYYIYDKTSGL